jgi:hypothetical protein
MPQRQAIPALDFHFEFAGIALSMTLLTLGTAWLHEELSAGPIVLRANDLWTVTIKREV